ncbi:MAG: aspartate--tRNA ligase [Oscillospiraceae bacterium]|nr:aspartate--tRNA ligase [Oscillospiraceae bacterium]
MDKMGELRRTHYAEDTVKVPFGETVTVAGFVSRTRDLGNLIFTDLRDNTGILQLAFDQDTDPEVFRKAEQLKSETVIMAKGVLRERSSKNKDIPTGDIELFVTDLRILNAPTEMLPFEIRDEVPVRDELSLKYRYLELRKPSMTRNLVMRHKIVKCTRDYFDSQHFLEIETPMLIKSTPEGARDYIVPSRVQPGHFYALPQSPQIYKQILMVAGYDRYMQIVRCFRDEDLRADRQPEFTQIDLEMSFADVDDVIAVNEGFLKKLFHDILGKDIQTPFRRMTWNDAMAKYGSDKPDLRFGLEITDLSETVKGCGFGVFASTVENGGSVCAINAKGLAEKLTRKEIDKLVEFVKTYKAKGIAFTRINADGTSSSSYEKFLSEDEAKAVREKMEAEAGDVILIIAGDRMETLTALGALRCQIARNFGLIEKGRFELLWVTDFPLFEYSEEEDRWVAMHHPFTAPRDEDMDKIVSDPGSCYAKAYDIVINGTEAGGGSIRISNPNVQQQMFEALGFTDESARSRFGFLMDAYKYGAPPHGGLAYGLDRLVMLLLELDTIRDVIAFPKVQNAGEPMSGCPDFVDQKQLEELHIKLDLDEE